MLKSFALHGFSDSMTACIHNTDRLRDSLNRLSDADQMDLSFDPAELTTAVNAISGAIRGVASVAELECLRLGL